MSSARWNARVSAEMKVYVLDSFALLAYLGGEAGEPQVKSVLAEALAGQAEIYLSIINYGEIAYITQREQGVPAAQMAIAAMDQLPLHIVEADRKLTLAAAYLKARYPISYADAFAVALARQVGATLLTGDPEFHEVEHLAAVEWLPKP